MSLESSSARLLATLSARRLTVAGAESCTGGLASSAITAIPGASSVFLGAIISYANKAKLDLLGVSPETLRLHGAVSEACAMEMALGAAKALGADCAYAITGIAGPSGALPGKPVGTVWLGFCLGDQTGAACKSLPGNRDEIRLAAADFALIGLEAFVAARIALDNSSDEGVSFQ